MVSITAVTSVIRSSRATPRKTTASAAVTSTTRSTASAAGGRSPLAACRSRLTSSATAAPAATAIVIRTRNRTRVGVRRPPRVRRSTVYDATDPTAYAVP